MSRAIRAGSVASFQLSDVECPDASQALRQIGPELKVTGQVIYLSDSGERREHFAVVDVHGIHTPLIVRVDRLRLALAEPQQDDARRRASLGERSRHTADDSTLRSIKPCMTEPESRA